MYTALALPLRCGKSSYRVVEVELMSTSLALALPLRCAVSLRLAEIRLPFFSPGLRTLFR